MAATYLIVPIIFRRAIVWPRLARIQPYLFAIGAGGISLFMMGAGTLGVARRHWDITFSDAQLTFEYPGTAFLMMGLNGVFAILAAAGGALYVVIVVMSILRGQRVDETNAAAALGPMPKRVVHDAVARYGNAGTWHLPGTYVLVAVFFLAFVLYYFVNWKYLSELWPIG
jgi:cytochrome c oxidase subunit 1